MPALPAPAPPEMTQTPMDTASAPAAAAQQQSAVTDEERERTMMQEMQVRHLQSMASELGYVLTSKRSWQVELALSISQRLVNREGAFIYQSAQYHIPGFPLEMAREVLSAALIQKDTKSCVTWKAETMTEVRTLIQGALEHAPAMTGLSKPLQKPSERVIRVLATLIPDMEISWVREGLGREKLYVNFMFVLSDEDGEVHPPKDSKRNEIAFSQRESSEIRREILQDVLQMSQAEKPLGAQYFRQLGMEERATEVEAFLAAPTAPAITAQQVSSRPSRTTRHGEINAVLQVVRTEGKARMWVLVRWEGYHASWEAWRIQGEVGTPLETWEPIANVRNTQAWRDWEVQELLAASH